MAYAASLVAESVDAAWNLAEEIAGTFNQRWVGVITHNDINERKFERGGLGADGYYVIAVVEFAEFDSLVEQGPAWSNILNFEIRYIR